MSSGIGVDDMFVIMGALNNLEPEEQKYDIPRKMGDVLRHAGVSITVTSITDFVAFSIGATTVSGSHFKHVSRLPSSVDVILDFHHLPVDVIYTHEVKVVSWSLQTSGEVTGVI